MNREAQLAQTRRRMGTEFVANQVLGRSQTIGCVAVEITQRCNLDCELCYLSEHSQQVRDIPIEEVYRRLDAVLSNYGVGTHVQITGGDPTLRKHRELIDIVCYASDLGLHPALFTNGIAASRKLLEQLAEVGLCDVAFHVDTTQNRKGYTSESQLNSIRRDYLDRARGLGLMVIFNTSIHQGNFHELPDLVAFFADHANDIGLVSLNLQAETGRGVLGGRTTLINQFSVRSQIEKSAGRQLPWDTVRIGHRGCHSYLPTLVANGHIHPVIDDPALAAKALSDFPDIGSDRHFGRGAIARKYGRYILSHPDWWWPGLKYLARQCRSMARDVVLGRGRIHKLTFFIQNFMDAENLDEERVHACSFMVMTDRGPVSMCEHNAKRDDYILRPLKVPTRDGGVVDYEPLVWRSQSEVTASR